MLITCYVITLWNEFHSPSFTLSSLLLIIDMKSDIVPSSNSGVFNSASDESSAATAGGMVTFNFYIIELILSMMI